MELSWNTTFFKGEVVAIKYETFESGEKVSIGIKGEKYNKKFFLYAWDDECNFFKQAELSVGDKITVASEMGFYKQNDSWKDCYRIKQNPFYNQSVKESQENFRIAHIERVEKEILDINAKTLSSKTMVAMMLGNI